MQDVSSSASRPAVGGRPRRSMKTARSVIVADLVADWVIRIGGIGVIAAVFGIMLFLAEVVLPLFLGASAGPVRSVSVPIIAAPMSTIVDEYNAMSVSIGTGGEVTAFHVKTGTPLTVASFDLEGKEVTAFNRTLSGGDM